MPKILITGTIPKQARKNLEDLKLDIIERGVSDLVEEKAFIDTIKDIDIYLNGGYEIITRAVLEAANALKLMIFLGTDAGTYIDLVAAKEKNVQVCNTPAANALSVAEFTVGLIINAQRRIPFSVAPSNTNNAYKTYHTAYGKTLGLIGFGNIGSHVS